MSKNISISDDVYEWLKKMKGDDSFSTVIRKLRKRKNLEDINGMNILEDWESTKSEIKEMSDKEWERLEDAA
ncbi:MAG: antitoxin VapB family protein [Candidatus Natronoplasma sp.]